jgi:hypothetical protein
LVREESGKLTACAPLPDEMLTLCEQRGIGNDRLLDTVYRLV